MEPPEKQYSGWACCMLRIHVRERCITLYTNFDCPRNKFEVTNLCLNFFQSFFPSRYASLCKANARSFVNNFRLSQKQISYTWISSNISYPSRYASSLTLMHVRLHTIFEFPPNKLCLNFFKPFKVPLFVALTDLIAIDH